MMRAVCIFLWLCLCLSSSAQVGVGTTNPNAQLDIVASNPSAPTSRDGLLIPRISAFPATNPSVSQDGMLVYLSTASGAYQPGFYYWNNAASLWISISSFKGWDTVGNANAISGTNFIGTVNAQDVDFRSNNSIKMRLTQRGQLEFLNNGSSIFIGEQAGDNDDETANRNSFIGYQSGLANTAGSDNIGLGYQSLYSNVSGNYNIGLGNGTLRNNTGNGNVAIGNNAMAQNTIGANNLAIGTNALSQSTTAFWNTGLGANALRNNTTGESNTATGPNSMMANTTGSGNTANGANSLVANVIGNSNTGIGFSALHDNTGGNFNTAIGSSAMYYNKTGSNNTAVGVAALINNETGNGNTASGHYALRWNVSGDNNTAIGRYALSSNLTGLTNTASGVNAMATNQSGSNNTASGNSALRENLTGDNNTAVGSSSLYNSLGSSNTAVGNAALLANLTGNNNTGIGNAANVSTSALGNATAIGNGAIVNASNKVRLGNAAVTVVEGQVAYFNPSDARFKYDVKQNVPGLDFIMRLKPVTYRFDARKFQSHLTQNLPDNLKTDADADLDKSSAILRTGFLAQDIEKAANEIGYDFDGLHKPDASNPSDNYSVAYSQFIMPLVKSVQEQQSEIEKLKAENAALKTVSANQKQTLDAIEARLSKLEKSSN